MKKIVYLVLGLIAFASCADDKGNYSYSPINEVKIQGFGEKDTIYYMLYQVDTLKIPVEIKGSLDSLGTDQYCSYRWELKAVDDVEFGTKVVATTRDLVLPMDIKPGKYFLYYKVKEENNKIITVKSASLDISTSYSKGLLVLGDREDGSVQLDMVAMVEARKDTVILRDMLKDSGLPEMKHARFVCHTGSSYNPSNVKLWVMSETGSYYLDGSNMTGSADNDFSSLFFSSLDVSADVQPVLEFPQLANGGGSGYVSGSNRGYLLSDGSLVWGNIISGEYYGNPVNRVQKENPAKLLKLFPYVFYTFQRLGVVLVYDVENERFLLGKDAYTPFLEVLQDKDGDVFPLNQKEKGRTLIHGDNTRNRLGGCSYGRSYALMKDQSDDYFIYCLYADPNAAYAFAPSSLLKKYCWNIKKELAVHIDEASHFVFSSDKPIFYYVVGNKIYAYNYTNDNEKCEVVADFGTEEITYFTVDYWMEESFDYVFVATYAPGKGGTIHKFRESQDQNKLELTKSKIVWSGFPRIKSLGWRNSAY